MVAGPWSATRLKQLDCSMNIPLIKAIVILPGTALVYIPALLVWLTKETSFSASFPPNSVILWLAGLLFAAAGLMLMFWTMRLFAVAGGGGTPAPWEPIKNFIALGPYRYVRNPMLIGVNLVLVTEAILLQSIPIILWMITFVILNTIYFALSEEPQLEKRFGEAYRDYKRNVPRWIPRLFPYRGYSSNA
jgi:protein-S-isoprenylcysteine O-methyltransferase Ste14